MYDPEIQEEFEQFTGRELTDSERDGLGIGNDEMEYKRIAFYAGACTRYNKSIVTSSNTIVSKTELEPCPCCNGRAAAQAGKQYQIIIQDWHDVDEALFQPCTIKCLNCGLSITRAACNAEFGGANGAKREAKSLAVNAWNRRHLADKREQMKQPTFRSGIRDFVEDFELENGNYMCTCRDCGQNFVGHKRRLTCKVCLNKTPATHYEFKPMEWKEYKGYIQCIWNNISFIIFLKKTKPATLEIWDRINNTGISINSFNSIAEAKAAAEKHRQGLIEKLGGVRT